MATDAPARPWREGPEGVVLAVRLTPRGGRDRLEGVVEVEGEAVLKARVAAAPVDGAANRALERLLANALGIARSAVEVTGGASSRMKRVSLAGEPRALTERLTALI